MTHNPDDDAANMRCGFIERRADALQEELLAEMLGWDITISAVGKGYMARLQDPFNEVESYSSKKCSETHEDALRECLKFANELAWVKAFEQAREEWVAREWDEME